MKHISEYLQYFKFIAVPLPSGRIYYKLDKDSMPDDIRRLFTNPNRRNPMSAIKNQYFDEINSEYDQNTRMGYYDSSLTYIPPKDSSDYPDWKMCCNRIAEAATSTDNEFTLELAEERLYSYYNYSYNDIYHLNPSYFDSLPTSRFPERMIDDEPTKTMENPNG